MEFVDVSHKGALNYLLFLLTFMVSNTIMVVMHEELEILETALICGLAMLMLDALFRKINGDYVIEGLYINDVPIEQYITQA